MEWDKIRKVTEFIAKCPRCGLIERYTKVPGAVKCPKCGIQLIVSMETKRQQ